MTLQIDNELFLLSKKNGRSFFRKGTGKRIVPFLKRTDPNLLENPIDRLILTPVKVVESARNHMTSFWIRHFAFILADIYKFFLFIRLEKLLVYGLKNDQSLIYCVMVVLAVLKI